MTERWSLERYNAEFGIPAKPNKYRNKPTGGYASVKEAKRARDLKIMQKVGDISELKEQPRFKFDGLTYDSGRTVTYRADFEYIEDGVRIIEDVKSIATRTPVYKIKKALMRVYYGIEVREV